MKNLLLRRTLAGLSLGALAAAGLATVPAVPAQAQVEETHIGGRYDLGDDAGCTPSSETGGDNIDEPWSDNNVTVTHSGSVSQTYTSGDNEEDKVDATSSMSASITSTQLGGTPATITASATATASALARGATTACEVQAEAWAQGVGFFTLAQPAWVTVTATGNGQDQGRTQGTSMVGIGSADGFEGIGFLGLGSDGLAVSAGNRGTAVSSTLLPAGEYGVMFAAIAYAQAHGTQEGTATFGGNFKIEFQTPGTASAVAGKGASKVQFGARDCANGNVPVALSKKTVKKAKSVKFRVDGKKALVLKGKKLKGKKPKAKTVSLPTAANATTKVKVKIKLTNGRTMQATRSYLPCR